MIPILIFFMKNFCRPKRSKASAIHQFLRYILILIEKRLIQQEHNCDKQRVYREIEKEGHPSYYFSESVKQMSFLKYKKNKSLMSGFVWSFDLDASINQHIKSKKVFYYFKIFKCILDKVFGFQLRKHFIKKRVSKINSISIC